MKRLILYRDDFKDSYTWYDFVLASLDASITFAESKRIESVMIVVSSFEMSKGGDPP